MASPITVSLLFTDIVDSTARSQRMGEARSNVERRAHFELLRGILTAHDGREVKNLGDGLMIAFASLRAAVDAAVAMQQAVESEGRATPDPLRIRVGVSTGDVTEEDGDYFGLPVIEAARLCSIASPGQVLTTDIVRALAGADRAARFAPLGERELKGLSEPTLVHEVRWTPLETSPAAPLPPFLDRAPTLAYVGRRGPYDQLDQLWKEASAGELRVALLSGEAGMGKTRLATELARAAGRNGAVVLFGRCDEEPVAYQPWAEALGHLVEHLPPDVASAVLPERSLALARLLPKLTPASGSSSRLGPSDAETERFELMTAVRTLLFAAGQRIPIMLVLDDLHWIDRASLHLLRHVIGSGEAGALMIVGTYRDTDLSASHPLTAFLADMHRAPGVSRLALTGLDQQEMVDLLSRITNQELDETGIGLAQALRRETSGNPFFVIEMLRHLLESGAVGRGDDGRWSLQTELESLGLPQSVREVVGRRIARLGDPAERLLSLAAVIGRQFEIELLAEVGERPIDEVLDILDEAARAGVVEEVAQRPGRYSFTHALIEHTLYESLSRARRRLVHERIGRALEVSVGRDPLERAGELARHWIEAAQPVDVEKAVRYSGEAGWLALARCAPDDAQQWFDQALELLLADGEADEIRLDLRMGLGIAQRDAGVAEYRATLVAAGRLARELGDVARLTRIALAHTRGTANNSDQDPERLELFRTALDANGPADSSERALLLATLANYLLRREEAQSASREALAIADRLGDPDTRFRVRVIGATLEGDEPLGARIRSLLDLADDAQRRHDLEAQFLCAQAIVYLAVRSADRTLLDRQLDRLTALADRTGRSGYRWLASMTATWHALLDGRVDDSERLAGVTLEIGATELEALTAWGAQMLEVRRLQGRTSELLPMFVDAARDLPDLGAVQAAVMECHVRNGDLDSARDVFERSRALGFPTTDDYMWLVTKVLYAETAVALGSRTACSDLYGEIAGHHDEIAFGSVSVLGPAARVLGRLSAFLGRPDDADAEFTQAIDLTERLGAPFWLAHTQLDWADVLLTSGRDRPRTGRLLEECRGVLERYDFPELRRRADELADELAAALDAP